MDRLFIGVLGHRNSGKSTTWNTLFKKDVRTGKNVRLLEIEPNKSVEVFLVSGSFEERNLYAGDILDNQNCRIVLCSLQYISVVQKTLDYVNGQNFQVQVQWLNPGNSDKTEYFDSLGLIPQLLSYGAAISMHNGKVNPSQRVKEILECVHGWAHPRGLVI